MMAFHFPCNLCPVDEVLILTGNNAIWHLNVSLISHKPVSFTVTATLCCSGRILNNCCLD